MSLRQRLRATVTSGAAEGLCWRCALTLSHKFSALSYTRNLEKDKHDAGFDNILTLHRTFRTFGEFGGIRNFGAGSKENASTIHRLLNDKSERKENVSKRTRSLGEMPRDKRALTSATQVTSESFPSNSKKNVNIKLTSETKDPAKNLNNRQIETERDQGAVDTRKVMTEDSRKRISIRKVETKDPVISEPPNVRNEGKKKVSRKNGSFEETLTDERFVTRAVQDFPQRNRLDNKVVLKMKEPTGNLNFRKIETEQDQKTAFIHIRDSEGDENEKNVTKSKVERVIHGTTSTKSFRKMKTGVCETGLHIRKVGSERNEDGVTIRKIDRVIRKVRPVSLFRSYVSKGAIPGDYVKELDISPNDAPDVVEKWKRLSNIYLRWSCADFLASRARFLGRLNARKRTRRPLGVLSARLGYDQSPTGAAEKLKEVPQIESTPPSLRLAEDGLPKSSPFDIHLDTAIGALEKFRHFTNPEVLQADSIRRVKRSVKVVGKEQNRSFATSSIRYSQLETMMPVVDEILPSLNQNQSIRHHLRVWQEQNHATSNLGAAFTMRENNAFGVTQNLISQSRDDNGLQQIDQENEFALDTRFDLEEKLKDIPPQEVYLQRGDMIELIHDGQPIAAVFTQNLGEQSQFYTMYGQWYHLLEREVTFMIPQMILPSDIDPILEYLPHAQVPTKDLEKLHKFDNAVPRQIGAKAIEKMRSFYESTNEIIRARASRLSQTFNTMAHPTKPSTASLQGITMKVLQIANPLDVSNDALWAVHRTVSRMDQFRADREYARMFSRYQIISKKLSEDMEMLRGWVREHQEKKVADTTGLLAPDNSDNAVGNQPNPISDFVAKARSRIRKSRKARAVTKAGCIGPRRLQTEVPKSGQVNDMEVSQASFDYQDFIIIRLLLDWSTTGDAARWSILTSAGPMILRATGMYEGFRLDRCTGFVFLQELGVVAPWLQRESFNPNMPVFKYHAAKKRDAPQLTQQIKRLLSKPSMKDSMRDLRQDWGNLAVYCIDSLGTKEVDDGVSLEEIPGDPSASWVHVHVANPSAFITPASAIARFAEEQTESLYFPDKNYPMLSPWLTQKSFSLANGRPCITFSAKLTTVGDLVEYKITHGVVQNVVHTTPNTINKLMYQKAFEDRETHTLAVGRVDHADEGMHGKNIHTGHVESQLTESDINTLIKLRNLGSARRHSRGGMQYERRKPDMDIQVALPANGASVYNPENLGYKSFTSDPAIVLTATTRGIDSQMTYEYIEATVSDLMILAGEIAALWCQERNLPIAYRGTLRNPSPPESPEAFREEHLERAVDQGLYPPEAAIVHYMSLVGRPLTASYPLPHIPMGLPAYTKVTSPLRRYVDLSTHWQIEAALRHEAATGTSLIGNQSDAFLPFSRAVVRAHMPRLSKRESIINQAKRVSTLTWALQLFVRAFYFHEATLPETFNVNIFHSGFSKRLFTNRGWLTKYGIVCGVLDNANTRNVGGVADGDVWEARIESINCFERNLVMEPLRLVYRSPFKARKD